MTDEARKIVAALRVVCGKRTCDDCPCLEWCHRQKENCLDDDAADMIEKLSAELKEARAMVQDAKEHAELFMEELTQVKRERDALKDDLMLVAGDTSFCEICKQYESAPCRGMFDADCFEWRGVTQGE